MSDNNIFPICRQQNLTDCGFCCLKIIASYYGREVNESDFQSKVSKQLNGVSLLDLSTYAGSIGFETIVVRVSFKKLRKSAPFPLIAWINKRHYTVIYKIDDSFVHASDPAFGLVRYEHANFINSWAEVDNADSERCGVALLLGV